MLVSTCLPLATACNPQSQSVTPQSESPQATVSIEDIANLIGSQDKTIDLTSIEELLQQNLKVQQETLEMQREILQGQEKTNELLQANRKSIDNLSNDFEAYKQGITDVIEYAKNDHSIPFIASVIDSISKDIVKPKDTRA